MTSLKITEDYQTSIARVLQFIDENLAADLSVENLSEMTFFSKYHFHRIFKGAVGESLAAYVIRRRLDRAAVLMKRNSRLSVTETALQVGFNSPEHFSRSFKNKFGVTANEFRRANSNDPNSLKNRKIYQELSDTSFYHIYQQSRELDRLNSH